MEATDSLMQEHRLIERVLDAMDGWVTTLTAHAEQANKDRLAQYISFIRGFADAYHHGKEEDILFAVMVQHGFPQQVGPIPVMVQEHEIGRSLVGVLDELAQQSAAWSDDDRVKLEQAARDFSALLRQHIRKEDLILYPMADARLPQAAQQEMSRRFQDFEQQQDESGEKQRLHLLAETLLE